MKHKLTYLHLFKIDQEFTSMQQHNPGLTLLNLGRIQLFYQQAASHLERMNKQLDSIKEKYVRKNDQGEFLTMATDKGLMWRFKASVSDIATATILTGPKLIQAFETETTDYLKSQSLIISF